MDRGSVDIPLHGASVSIVRKCASTLSNVLKSKFGCVAFIDGVDFEGYPSFAQQKRPTVAPENRFHVTLPTGVAVSVWKADLTNFHVDAVVNAANEQLNHCGGLARDLSSVGGPQIQKESDDYISKHGLLHTGGAIITNAGSLPCKKIIHAVGPSLSKYASGTDFPRAERLLEKAIVSILKTVDENFLQSVAIPAISSGIFSFPLPECANIIVGTVKHYYSNSTGHRPQEIMLVNFDEPSVKEMERACLEILTNRQGRAAPNASIVTFQTGKVVLKLSRGHIEEQQTDVIVNTAFDKDLRKGQISTAILQKAGYEMQQDLYNVRKGRHVIFTKPFRLSCKEVYHTFWGGVDAQAFQQRLYESVQECLLLAAKHQHRSIAFPAIGTGGLKYEKRDAAKIMTKAVADFGQTLRNLMDVYFVIFPSEDQTFQAFEEEIRKLQQNAPHPGFTQAPMVDATMSSPPVDEHREKVPSSRSPQIKLTSHYDATTLEAKRWLCGLLFEFTDTVVVRNNFILHFGEKEYVELSRLEERGVSISEHFKKGCASIAVRGYSHEDVAVAVLQVEAMLCRIQREFVRKEEGYMSHMMEQPVSFNRKPLDYESQGFRERVSAYKRVGMQLVKVDKVENDSLVSLFELKRNQLHCSNSQRMFQRVPAQFCDMVSHIGFHSEYAPPDDPAYGEGIYFTSSVKRATEVWKEPSGEYVHFVEAYVLTGTSAPGHPALILPPAAEEKDTVYASVSGPEICVIFSGYQALPKYIVTCKMI